MAVRRLFENVKYGEELIGFCIICACALADYLQSTAWWVFVAAFLLSLDGWPRYRPLMQRAKRIDRQWRETEALAREQKVELKERPRVQTVRVIMGGLVASYANSFCFCLAAWFMGHGLRVVWAL